MPIGWLPIVLYLLWWIRKRKPYSRTVAYRFPQYGFTVKVRRW